MLSGWGYQGGPKVDEVVMGKKKSFNNDYDFARESNHLTAIARERVSFDRYHATTFVLESLRERAIERPCLRVRICE